jgi:hypothetical protein
MPNPFRREQDAFRMLLAFVAGAVVVIAVTLASEPVYGAVVGVGLLGFGAGKLWSDFRHWQAGGAGEGPPGAGGSPG